MGRDKEIFLCLCVYRMLVVAVDWKILEYYEGEADDSIYGKRKLELRVFLLLGEAALWLLDDHEKWEDAQN